MLKGLGDLGQMMKIQRELKNVQNRIAKSKIEGSSADGSVNAVMTGEYKLVGLSIADEIFQNGDSKKLEKLVAAAINDAVDRVKEYSKNEMKKLTGGMDIPGMGDLLK